MKIVADSAIPFLKGVFEPYADVNYYPGKEICREYVRDADALIIRSRTKCNADLLEGSKVKIIATASIGTDHIDFPYCNGNGIDVSNARGCTAGGVMQYVFSALYGTAARKSIKLDGLTFGIIGVGNVGSLVEKTARHLGFNVLLCDPPRAALEGSDNFCSLEYLLANSGIVTMHTPLDDTTRFMADSHFFSLMKPGTFFINASRGEVVDESALLEAMPKLGPVIIDTWDNEPNVNRELVSKVDIATPHIAGYSLQGKQNGTVSAVHAIAGYFGIEDLYAFAIDDRDHEHEAVRLDLKGKSQGEVAAIFQYNYPIFTDDFMFRIQPDNFEQVRSEYKYRREIIIEQ